MMVSSQALLLSTSMQLCLIIPFSPKLKLVVSDIKGQTGNFQEVLSIKPREIIEAPKPLFFIFLPNTFICLHQ